MAANIIDPFDSETPSQKGPPISQSGIVDPFDDVPNLQDPGWQTRSAPSYSPGTSAGLGTTAVASLASTPKQRIPYYAEQRGIPVDRYRVVSGRVAYQDDRGQWNYEESPHNIPRSFGEAVQQIASGVGPAIPAVAGGTVGILSAPALLAGPAGLAGSVTATGAAAGAGEAARQVLADQFVSPKDIDYGKVAAEALQASLGQGIGAGIGAWQQRWAMPDVIKYSPASAEALEQKAAAQGIQLTPAESTNLASLKAQQKYLGNMPQSADEMASFYERRAKDQVAPAVGRYLDKVSPQGSAAKAGMSARDAAIEAIEAAYKKRTAEVQPAYKAVVRPESTADVSDLLGDDFFRGQVEAVKKNSLYGMQSHDDMSLTVLDQVKKNLDDMIATAKQGGERNKVRLYEQRRTELLKATDAAFPEYKAARALFEAKSPEVEEIAGSVLKTISGLKDTQAQKAAGMAFGEGSSPEQIAIARRELEKRTPGVWQDLKRAWLQVEWEKANKETLSGQPVNAGSKWRLRLLGNPEQAKRTKAALDANEYKALEDLAEVLDAAGRVKPIGSDTAWNQEMQKIERDRVLPAGWRYLSNALSPQKWGEMMKDWASEKALAKHANEIAQIIQQPNGRALLREIRLSTPGSMRRNVLTGHLLMQIPSAATGRSAPTQKDQ